MKTRKNISLYVHIPFCAKKCRYCDFFSGPASFEEREKYIADLIKSLEQHRELAKDYQVISIFFGGGTPSILTGEQFVRIMEGLKSTFLICEDAEISIEVNPGTVTKEKWKAYQMAGVNRVSFGLQSTKNEELKFLGRIHTYEDFLESYKAAREAGFQNINIDLISSLPGQTKEDYLESLHRVVALEPEHISAYSLILEEGTPFYEMFYDEKGREKTYVDEQGKSYKLLSEEMDRDIYHATKEVLEEAGYFRYEISNYAKEGFACKHNCVYWKRGEYLGLGAMAASFLGNCRYQNEMKTPFAMVKTEEMNEREEMSETMLVGLRMTQGVFLEEFQERFGKSLVEVFEEQIVKCQKEGLLAIGKKASCLEKKQEEKESIFLTELGLDLSNQVMMEFL